MCENYTRSELGKFLRSAVRVSSLKLVNEALTAGADPNYRSVSADKSILSEAISDENYNRTDVDIVRALLRAGVKASNCTSARFVALKRLKVEAERPASNRCDWKIRNLETTVAMLDKALQANHMVVAKALAPESTINLWRNLLFSQNFSDVTFVFPDGDVLHAHKCVLAAASPYFDAYFKGPWGSSHPNGRWKTKISRPVMKAVLTFIYTGDTESIESLLTNKDKNEDTLGATLAVAVQYQLPTLQSLVESQLMKSLTLTTVKDTLMIGHLHNSKPLKLACFGFIRGECCRSYV